MSVVAEELLELIASGMVRLAPPSAVDNTSGNSRPPWRT
jgi:hypothetical protein